MTQEELLVEIQNDIELIRQELSVAEEIYGRSSEEYEDVLSELISLEEDRDNLSDLITP